MKHTDKLTVLFDKVASSINQRKEISQIIYLKYYEEIIKTLIKEGIVRSYIIKEGMLVIFLNIHSNIHIKFIRISKPGKRVYLTYKEILKLNHSTSFNGLYLISTSQGIMSHQQSYMNQIGGEVITKINYAYSK